ncbi:MAG: Sec-independent protein translocase protein TatAy [bacterium ADurb.Bin478]|nr:MAG: Sec-independent protein translocase protein TatAy [bacterium ADurb.Bin478]
MGIGVQEWFIIILVLVVLFGAKKIPELAKGLGQGIKEFKKAANSAAEDEEPKKQNPA